MGIIARTLFLLMFYVWPQTAQALIHIEKGFHTVEVFRGESAEFICHYNITAEDDDWSMTWSALSNPADQHSINDTIFYRDPETQKIEQNTSYSDRVSVEVQNGKAKLTIHDVQLYEEQDITVQQFVFEIRQAHDVKACHYVLEVYDPKTRLVFWMELPTPVYEGNTVLMRCSGDRPIPVLFKKQGSDEELESHGDSLLFQKVTRDHSGEYECHSLGPDPVMTSLSLTVHYLDQAVTVPKNVAVVLIGDSLTLACHALSSLETSTIWIKDGRMIGEGGFLHLENVTFDTAGQYDCVVTVHFPAQTSASVRVSVYADHKFVIPVIVSVLLLVVIVLGGGVLYFLFQKGKISFGRSERADFAVTNGSSTEQERRPLISEGNATSTTSG